VEEAGARLSGPIRSNPSLLSSSNLSHAAVPLVEDRWEAFIPVAPDKDFVRYHYKFDFLDDVFGGKPKADSLMSAPYQLSVK